MLHFAKRLASKGLKVTLSPTPFMTKSMNIINTGSITVEPNSNGCDERGFEEINNVQLYLERLRMVGSQYLIKIIEKHQHSSNPLRCLVYDSFLP